MVVSRAQIAELNQVVEEVAKLYSQKVKYIVDQTPEDQDPVWKLDDLEELRKIREQLKLLFRIRDNCYRIIEDIERLNDSFCLLN
jgi:mRNA-degrading endonuclease RelE of RelBE toxin-antitoxin system